MKQIKLFGLLLIVGSMLLTSCEADIIDPIDVGGGSDPQVVLIDQLGYVSSDITLNPGESFSVLMDATAGDADLQTLYVEKDGTQLGATEYTIDGVQAASTQTLLFASDITGFTKDITITTSGDRALSTYAFFVTDVDGNSSSTSILVDTDVAGGEAPDVEVGGAASIELDANSLYSINISATPLSGTLASIAVYQDDVLISDLSRLEFDSNDFTANPYPFPTAYANGFTDTRLFIRVQDSGSSVYRVEIADEFGGITSFEKTVSVPTGTAVETLVGILLNQAGPAGTGGLDLETGNSVGSTDGSADIADTGIDINQPNASNWNQSITSVNGSTIRVLTAGQNGLTESFTFGSVGFKEDIVALHANNSAAYSGGIVLVGDVFTVESGGSYYLLEVTNVNVTTADNNDSYTFNVKK